MRLEKKDIDELYEYSNSKCKFCNADFDYIDAQITHKGVFFVHQVYFVCETYITTSEDNHIDRGLICYENEIKALKEKLKEAQKRLK